MPNDHSVLTVMACSDDQCFAAMRCCFSRAALRVHQVCAECNCCCQLHPKSLMGFCDGLALPLQVHMDVSADMVKQ